VSKNGATRILAAGLIAGLAGVVIAALVSGWERFWVNWILWFLFLMTIGLGCLFIVALEHTVGAKWSVPLRRVPERLSGLAVLMGPAALLALLSLPKLYPWTSAESLKNPVIAGKAVWLNVPFFAVRVAVCLGLWLLAHRIFVGGSLRQDVDGNPRFTVRARRFAPVFMAIFGITITILAFDWISSLEPAWYSDIFGVYVFAGTFLAGLAATTLALLYLMARGKLPGVGPDHVYNLGGFLCAVHVDVVRESARGGVLVPGTPRRTLGSPGPGDRGAALLPALFHSHSARREERSKAAGLGRSVHAGRTLA
jgi:hypothetical protein